ncbi:MAG: SRPBCC domain-containing protein [Coriobacteriia bacterium]
MSEHAFEASATISATPQQIWDVLVDAAAYPTWDSGVVSVDGHIGDGETITVHAAVNPGRAFPVRVTDFDAPTKMKWTGGMPLGLFVGERTFTLTPTEDGGSTFHMREEYHGPLTGAMWRSMPDLQPSFEQFANGLKARAERE